MPIIKIVTDSTAYLRQEDIQKYEISVVPLNVTFDGENFKENEKNYEEFYKQLDTSKGFPTTSQPAIGEFQIIYRELLKSADEIISIHISEKISGTYISAATAASEINPEKIKVFDSAFTASALEDMVLEAAEMANQGKTAKEIIQRLEFIKDNLSLLFIVDNLKYLRKGGRIGKAAEVLGSVLKIKPILYIKGEVGVFDKVRTKKKALIRLVDELKNCIEKHGGPENINVTVLNVNNKKGLIELKEMILEKWPQINIKTSSCGPVIGAHVGSGGLGLAFWPKN